MAKLVPELVPVPSSVAPAPTASAPVPVAEPEALFSTSEPPPTVVPPLYVLALVTVSVPVLDFVSEPVPLITPVTLRLFDPVTSMSALFVTVMARSCVPGLFWFNPKLPVACSSPLLIVMPAPVVWLPRLTFCEMLRTPPSMVVTPE